MKNGGRGQAARLYYFAVNAVTQRQEAQNCPQLNNSGRGRGGEGRGKAGAGGRRAEGGLAPLAESQCAIRWRREKNMFSKKTKRVKNGGEGAGFLSPWPARSAAPQDALKKCHQ